MAYPGGVARPACPFSLAGHQPALEALNAFGQAGSTERAAAGVGHLADDFGLPIRLG
jgi:hypothetical protein